MVSAVHECKLVIRCRTSSGPCLTLIRILSRAVYEARDEARRECIIRDTTRARFGNRTATSHDSGSKQITRDGSCTRRHTHELLLVPFMPARFNTRTVHAHECQLVPGRHCHGAVSVTTHARVLVRSASSPRPTTRVPFRVPNGKLLQPRYSVPSS